MAFRDMVNELRGCVPKIPVNYCRTLVNRAWREVRERNLWSFLLAEGQWISPAQITTGTATTTQGSPQVVMDEAAAIAINANGSAPYSLLTQRQFRIGSGGIYNIVSWDDGTDPDSPNPGVPTLTLDRMFGELSVTASIYQIYQVYYATPVKDFLRFVSIRDMQNFIDLFVDRTREDLDQMDPQRTWYYFPTWAVPYRTDLNPQSATYQFMMYELWGAPQYSLNYQLMYERRGTDLVNPSDLLPPAIGEDVVMAKARFYAYEWAEGNKGIIGNNQGPDYRFLMGAAQKEFESLLKNYRRQDRELVDNYFITPRYGLYGKIWPQYNSISQTAYPG